MAPVAILNHELRDKATAFGVIKNVGVAENHGKNVKNHGTNL